MTADERENQSPNMMSFEQAPDSLKRAYRHYVSMHSEKEIIPLEYFQDGDDNVLQIMDSMNNIYFLTMSPSGRSYSVILHHDCWPI